MEEQVNPLMQQNNPARNVYVQKHGIVVNTDLQTGREINYSADIELANRSRENYFSMAAMDNSREEITRGYLTQAASGLGGGAGTALAELYNFTKNTTFNVVNNAVALVRSNNTDIAKQYGFIDEETRRRKQEAINQEYENIAQFGREELLKLKDWQNNFLQKAGLGKEEGDTFIYDLSNGASSMLGALALGVITKSPNAAAVMFGGIAGQSGYEEALQNGIAPNKALGIGVLRGIAEGSLEKIGLHVFLEGMTARGFFTRALKGFATEAIQEGSQQTAEEFIQSQFGGRAEDFKTAIKSIAASALLGGLLGGPVSAVGGIFMKESKTPTTPTGEKTAAQKDSNTVEIPQDPKRIMAMVAYNGAKQLEGFGLAPEKAEQLAWAIVKETGSGKTIADMKEMIADELNPLTYTNAKEEDSASEFAAVIAPKDTKPQYEAIRQKSTERFIKQGLKPEEAEIGGKVEENIVQIIAAQQNITPEQAAQQINITVEQTLTEEAARAKLIQKMSTMDGAEQDEFWKNAQGKTFNEKLKELNLYRNKLAAESGALEQDEIIDPTTGEVIKKGTRSFNQSEAEDKNIKTDSPEFKKWFGDSKVVDEKGQPLVVYHGTNQEFSVFDKSRRGKSTRSESSLKGFFFTDDSTEGQEYADYANKTIVVNEDEYNKKTDEFKQNLAKAEKMQNWELVDKITAEWENYEQEATSKRQNIVHNIYLKIKNPLIYDFSSSGDVAINISDLITQAKDNNNDGVILKNIHDRPTWTASSKRTTQYIVFEPTQIKSVNNKGTFDENNPNIYYQSAADEKAATAQLFTPDTSEAARYKADLQKALNGGFKFGQFIKMGQTPVVYKGLGLNSGDLNLPINVVKKATEIKHNVPLQAIENLPQLIANPIMVFKSSTEQGSLVAMLNQKDANGEQVIAILKPVGDKINVIPSVYGKNNFDNFVKRNIENNNVVYADINEASKTIRPNELQLLKEDSLKGSSNILQTKEGIVKTYNQSRKRATVDIDVTNGWVKAVIKASKTAEESSFVHEMAHIWLTVFEDVYTREDYQEIRQDLDRWLGKPRGGIYSESQQEKFAEGFEQYLKEGKAPLPYLQQVFEQFRAWLTNIYKGIDIRNISPAARNVYAKMLGAEKAEAGKTVTFYQSAKKDYGKMRDAIEKIKADKLEVKDLNGLDLEKLKEFIEILNKPAPALPARTLITDLRSSGASYANANQTDAEVFKNARVPNRQTGIGDKPANWLRDRGYMEFEDAKTYDEQTKIDEQAHELINKALNGETVYKLEDLERVQLHQDYLEAVKMAQDVVGGSTQTYNKVIKSIELLRKKGFRVVNKADLSFMEQKIEEVANLLESERLIAQANTSMEREELKKKGRADQARKRKYEDSIKEYKDKAAAVKKAILEELGRREIDGKEKVLAAMEKAATVEEIYSAADDVMRFIEDAYGNSEAGKQSKAKYALPAQDWDNRRLELLKDLKEINQKTDINATWARTAIEREGRITPHRAGITQQDINTPSALDERQRKINLWKAEKILDEQLRNRYYKAFESALGKIPALKAQQKAMLLSPFNRIGYANKAAPALAEEVLNKAKEYVERNYKNTIKEKIKEILQMPIFEKHGSLRTAKYTKTAQNFLRRAYEISSLTDEQAQDSFRIAAERENYDEAKSKEQKLLDRLLQFKAAPYMVSPETAKRLLDDMEELRRASRSEVRFAKFFKDTSEENLREKLITAMEKQIIPAGGAAYVKKLANWQSIVNTIFGTHEFDEYNSGPEKGAKKVKINFMDVLSLEQNDIEKKNHIADLNRQVIKSFGNAYGYKNGNDYIKKLNEMLSETYTFDNYGAIEDNDPTQTERQKQPFKESINKLDLLFFWIQSQNDVNDMRLSRAYREQYTNMFKTLSAQDKAAGRELMKIAQSTWEAMNTVHERDRGFSLGKAQNYFPNRVERIEGGLDFLRGALTSNAAPSAIKQRVQTDKVIEKAVNPISLLMSEISRNAEYIYGSEDINKLRRIFRTFEMKTAFENKFGTNDGKEIYQKVLKMIDLNSPSVTLKANSGFFEKANFLFNNWVKSSIGLKPITAIKQFASTFNYAEEMPVATWMKGFSEALANPKETIKFMKELSPYIQTRFEQGGMNETLGRAMSMNEVTGAAAKINNLTNAITFNVRYGDMYSLCFGGKPYVDYLIKEKGYTRKQAQEAFEKATVRSQQADLKSTLAEAQMEEGNIFWRAAWSFRNQQMQYVRKMADAYVDFKNGNIDEKTFAKKIFIYGVINPTIYTLLSMGYFSWDDDDKENDYWNIATSPVTQFAGAVPFGDDLTELMFSNLRSLINKGQLTGAKGYELAGIEDMGRTFNKFVKNFNADDVTISDWLDVLADAGQFSGFGTKTIKSQSFGVKNIFQGKFIKGIMQVLGYTENRAGKVTGQEAEKKKVKKLKF